MGGEGGRSLHFMQPKWEGHQKFNQGFGEGHNLFLNIDVHLK